MDDLMSELIYSQLFHQLIPHHHGLGDTALMIPDALTLENEYVAMPQPRRSSVIGKHTNKEGHHNDEKCYNKYTLRIKSSENNADDGYKWRKYGQKSIKNSPNPRSYYRCSNPRCGAKKQVERSGDDPDTIIITYQGLHLHFIFPFLHLQSDQHDHHPLQSQPPPPKKKKIRTSHHDTDFAFQQMNEARPACPSESTEIHSDSQGLLEDMVPLLIRRPAPPAAQPYTPSFESSSSPNYYSNTRNIPWSPPPIWIPGSSEMIPL